MKTVLFGGTFDPIHIGHLRAAKAAARKFELDRVLFVPAAHPPHKLRDRLTPFPHRFAMVALACASDPRFVPSLLQAPTRDERPQYSITSVRAAKRALGAKDHLSFLVGVDAFLDLPHWKDYRRLLDLVDFIVVSRPGFDARQIRSVLPADIAGRGSDVYGQRHAIRLRQSTLRILPEVNAPVASRDIREAIRARRPITGLVPPIVEKYILKEELYR